jgi:4-carboxymuconolactone decarboxylase
MATGVPEISSWSPLMPKINRLAPLDPDKFTDEQAELAGGRGSPRSQLNIVRTLVHNPSLYRSWMPFAMHLIAGSALPPREREILILRTCVICGGKYDVAHHRAIAHRAGVSAADVEAALSDGSTLPEFERVLMKAAEELVSSTCRISDATYAALSERYSSQQMLDLVFTVGNYKLMCMTSNTFDVSVEADIEGGWNPDSSL